ncbi:MAG: Na(+)-translocating NADH-quinone reductase subunit A [Chlorobi bacterium]|nr:Na(+)-translocating NADH-quinone reductase subunit A [Chlorobiota bacterium]
MSKVINLKRGLDIHLKGVAEKSLETAPASETYAVKPYDFPDLTPKLSVKPGEPVKTGTPLFYDKYRPEVVFTSPVSGTVKAVSRGERRRILEVVIDSDGKDEAVSFKKGDPKNLSGNEIKDILLKSGVWPFIRQRPFDLIANPEDTPKAIFISLFDTAPLAPDYAFILKDKNTLFQAGLDVLSKLTGGKPVHVGYHPEKSDASFVSGLTDVETHAFKGPHPAGNTGVQIHHIDPINKGEVVWVVNPQDILVIGRLFTEGVYNPERIVALAGSEVKSPKYYVTKIGASVKGILDGNLVGRNNRYISGNVLTGKKISREGYIGFYDSLVSVIPEGNKFELLGWALPGFGKFSFYRTFFSWLTPEKPYRLDTNLHGGRRAFVLTGQYEKVLPMDIYPMHLIKAILVDDIDMMENLGIYEVVEEDIALCEFIDVSKTEMQTILREGFRSLIKELG